MANKGLNKARFRVGNVPNIGSRASSNCNKPPIRREAAAVGARIIQMEFSHNCSRFRALNLNNCPMEQNKLSAIRGERGTRTSIFRCNFVTINIPLPNSATRCRYEVLRVQRKEMYRVYTVFLLDNAITLPFLSILQVDCLIMRP